MTRRLVLLMMLFQHHAGFSQTNTSTDTSRFFSISGKNRFASKKVSLTKPALFIGFAGLTYGVYRFGDSKIKEETQEHRSPALDRTFGTIEPLGRGNINALAVGAATLTSFAIKNKKLQKTAVVWGASMLVSDFVTNQLKSNFQRHRPNTGSSYNTFDWRNGSGKNRSFVSAHTSNIFTTATVFATMYKEKKWVPVVAYGFASAVGVSRIYSNAHWTSDVMAGAAVGFLSAKGVNFCYNKMSKRLLFLPSVSRNNSSITVFYSF